MIPEDILNHEIASQLNEGVVGAVITGSDALGELTLEIDPSKILEVCRHLRQAQKFVRLSSVTAVDWSPAEPRFEVVYHLHSIERNERVRLKCRLNGSAPEIDSVTPVWRGANWYERETFDLFGIQFRGHPNLKRILMPEDWEGYPLRKDFPVHGYKYSYQGE